MTKQILIRLQKETTDEEFIEAMMLILAEKDKQIEELIERGRTKVTMPFEEAMRLKGHNVD